MASLDQGMARVVGQQVEQMILQAKKDSETRVQQELSLAHLQLRRLDNAISELSEKVAERVSGRTLPEASQGVDEAYLTAKLHELEQKWAGEVKALKQDLHRTILAHNHNSDLMRIHREALDAAKAKLEARAGPRSEQVDAQIEQVERLLRQRQAKYQALEVLEEFLAVLEGHVADAGPTPPRAQAAPPTRDGGGAKSLNAEAPVFVPRTAATAAGPEAAGDGETESTSAGEGVGAPPGILY